MKEKEGSGNPRLSLVKGPLEAAKALVKITLNLPHEEYYGLKELAERKRLSVTEAFRRAIALFRFVADRENEYALLIEHKRTGRISEVSFPW